MSRKLISQLKFLMKNSTTKTTNSKEIQTRQEIYNVTASFLYHYIPMVYWLVKFLGCVVHESCTITWCKYTLKIVVMTIKALSAAGLMSMAKVATQWKWKN